MLIAGGAMNRHTCNTHRAQESGHDQIAPRARTSAACRALRPARSTARRERIATKGVDPDRVGANGIPFQQHPVFQPPKVKLILGVDLFIFLALLRRRSRAEQRSGNADDAGAANSADAILSLSLQ